jgi:hypothetical protein
MGCKQEQKFLVAKSKDHFPEKTLPKNYNRVHLNTMSKYFGKSMVGKHLPFNQIAISSTGSPIVGWKTKNNVRDVSFPSIGTEPL